jgi:hypothetical protein
MVMKYKLIILSFLGMLFFSCDEIIMEEDLSDSQLVILAPADDAGFNSTSVTFTWQPLDGATSYVLQIAKPDFDNATEIVLNTEIEETTFTQQLNIGSYQWRIKAKNSSYETTFITRNLTVVSNDDFASNVVVLTSPNNALITNTSNYNLSWNGIIGATAYQLQILDETNAIILDQEITTNTYNYTFSEGNFTWKVRATNGSDYTLYSSRSILVDQTTPNTPALISPADDSTMTNSDIDFAWDRTPINGATEFDSIYVFTDASTTNLLLKERANTNPNTINIPNTGTYYWKMKSFDDAGNESGESSVYSFILN